MWTGTALNKIYISRAATLGSLGLQTTLTVKDLTKAITGFIQIQSLGMKISFVQIIYWTCEEKGRASVRIL